MNLNHLIKCALVLASPLILIACAGGGGGGSSSSSSGTTVTPFTSWSAVTANSTVQAYGGSTISSAATGNTQSITGGSFLGTYDSTGNLSSFTLGASEENLKNFQVKKQPEVVGIYRELKEGEDIDDPVTGESIRPASY